MIFIEIHKCWYYRHKKRPETLLSKCLSKVTFEGITDELLLSTLHMLVLIFTTSIYYLCNKKKLTRKMYEHFTGYTMYQCHNVLNPLKFEFGLTTAKPLELTSYRSHMFHPLIPECS